MHLLDRSAVLKPLDDLGFAQSQARRRRSADQAEPRDHLGHRPDRLGKTTTLYGCLSKINSPDKNILTIEDPVEYQLEGVGRFQLTEDRPHFRLGPARLLRQDRCHHGR